MQKKLKTFFTLSILVFSLAACQESSKSQSLIGGDTLNNGIVGGEKATRKDAISKHTVLFLAVSKGKGKDSICTAFILAKRLLITAAHCMKDVSKASHNLYIYLGNFDQNNVDQNKLFTVAKTEFHPRLKTLESEGLENDLLLVKLSKDIPSSFKPVGILTTPLFEGQNISVAGFGLTKPNDDDHEPILKKFDKFEVAGFDENEVIVVTEGKEGSYFGDSGGPGYVLEDGVVKAWGVLSRGASDDETGEPEGVAIYEDFRRSATWINDFAKRSKISFKMPVMKLDPESETTATTTP